MDYSQEETNHNQQRQAQLVVGADGNQSIIYTDSVIDESNSLEPHEEEKNYNTEDSQYQSQQNQQIMSNDELKFFTDQILDGICMLNVGKRTKIIGKTIQAKYIKILIKHTQLKPLSKQYRHLLFKEVASMYFKQSQNTIQELYAQNIEIDQDQDVLQYTFFVQYSTKYHGSEQLQKKLVNGDQLALSFSQYNHKEFKQLSKEKNKYFIIPQRDQQVETQEEIVKQIEPSKKRKNHLDQILEYSNGKTEVQVGLLGVFYSQNILRQGITDVVSKLAEYEAAKQPKRQWTWHLDPNVRKQYPKIGEWFDTYVLQYHQRSKALILYSPERGMGKTLFVYSLTQPIPSTGIIPYPERVLYNRNTFSSEMFQHSSTAQLLFLDDMNFDFVKQYEMLKAIVAGQETTIVDKYLNKKYNPNGRPVVIATNDHAVFVRFILDQNFSGQVYGIEINNYMGPTGTRPEFDYTLKNTNLTIHQKEILSSLKKISCQEIKKERKFKYDKLSDSYNKLSSKSSQLNTADTREPQIRKRLFTQKEKAQIEQEYQEQSDN